jgi:hypothetical protein
VDELLASAGVGEPPGQAEIRRYAIWRRDGASQLGSFHDPEAGDHYLETFLVNSSVEHQRQNEMANTSDKHKRIVTWSTVEQLCCQ